MVRCRRVLLGVWAAAASSSSSPTPGSDVAAHPVREGSPLVSPGTRMPQSPQSVRNGGHNRPPSPAKWAKKEKGPSLDSDRSRDEDELFLLSFVPALKRLAPQKRYQTKLKIQQIMYEAEFNVEQPESNHTNLPETQD